jgi:hypothetical protein
MIPNNTNMPGQLRPRDAYACNAYTGGYVLHTDSISMTDGGCLLVLSRAFQDDLGRGRGHCPVVIQFSCPESQEAIHRLLWAW